MSAIAAFYAEQALALAHERQAAYRSEAEQFRLAAMPARGSRFASVRARLTSIRAAIARVEVTPVELPHLANYPYRG